MEWLFRYADNRMESLKLTFTPVGVKSRISRVESWMDYIIILADSLHNVSIEVIVW